MTTAPDTLDPTPDARGSRGAHRVAVFAAAFTWPLLLVGGSVTVYRVGMAVPDWPTTFGINMFLYRFWEASWGVFIEHGHRLYGSAVGLACIVLAAWSAIAERRAWLKWLGALALLTVIGQGFLGGYRVRYNSTNLALIHGCTAQAFFAFMVALAVLTGRDWSRDVAPSEDTGHLRRRSLVTLVLVAAQIVAGAVLRHRGEGLVVHAILATAVWGHVAALAWRIERHKADVPALVPSARAMALAVTAQVALGVVAWLALRPFDGIPRTVTTPQALVRIAHQGVGALLLAASVVLTLRAFRHLAAPAISTGGQVVPGLRDLEAVA
jgi:cytochrome c oxidase assembly protein subunit 15